MGQYYKPSSIEKKQHVYSHDYDNGLKLMEHSYVGNNFVNAVMGLLIEGGAWYKDRIVWAGDYADGENGEDSENLYHIVGENNIKPEVKELPKAYRYLCNHTIKQFVDLDTITEAQDGWTIHPLPLLTCDGNGRGGGDYRGTNPLVGTWAKHSISIETVQPEGYAQISGNFIE